jgi:hypothetical protein
MLTNDIDILDYHHNLNSTTHNEFKSLKLKTTDDYIKFLTSG